MKPTMKTRSVLFAVIAVLVSVAGPVGAAEKKPNILVIFGDDIGTWNVGAYTHGMMGRTPNIDSLATGGMLFTDHYGQPSCTAGRAAFITGQLPVRTGMTTIGIPGSTRGIQKSDPTLAEVLKTQGYATAQFGKNHLGDRNEFLPTVHGFDEWFGNLYHLNAEEEPEELDYPGQKNPAYLEKFGPRGVLHTWATDTDDPTADPKFGRVGKQKIEDTGKLTRKRMETFDAEVTAETLKWLDKTARTGKQIGDMTYKVHLDGYNNMAHWTGESQNSARREIFYYDETDLMAVRVDGWKMHIGVKHNGVWFDEKSYPSVPYLVNLLMDPMEKMTPDSEEWGYISRKFFASKLWAPTASTSFIAAHLKSLMEYPPSQGADTLSMKKAIEEAMKKMESPQGSSN